MINFSRIIANATGVAGQVGVASTATIARHPLPNALTGVVSGSPVTQTVANVLQAKERRYVRKGDAAWTQARVILFVAAENVSWAPKRGDVCTWGGVSAPIAEVEEYAPAGTAIGWHLAVGAGVSGGSHD